MIEESRTSVVNTQESDVHDGLVFGPTAPVAVGRSWWAMLSQGQSGQLYIVINIGGNRA